MQHGSQKSLLLPGGVQVLLRSLPSERDLLHGLGQAGPPALCGGPLLAWVNIASPGLNLYDGSGSPGSTLMMTTAPGDEEISDTTSERTVWCDGY